MIARIYLSLCIGITAFSLLAASAGAATYYVDYSAGSDSNAGTSTGVAWQHCPGDANASGTASSAVLNPGDTVYFKGGVSYVLVGSGITVAPGTAGSPVTYDGNSTGTWGTGMAVITDNNSANSITAFRSSSSFIANASFKGFRFTNIGGGPLPPDLGSAIPAKPGYGISALEMTNVFVSGCYFGQIGYYQQLAPIGNSSLLGDAIECNAGCSGLTITNCEFTQIRDPIQLSGGNVVNTTIAKCNFHDQMEWAITVLHTTTSYRSNLYIFSCTFSNTDQYYTGTNAGGLWTAYGDGPHENAIMMFGAEGCGGNCALDRPIGDTNVFIYNNYFVNTLGHPGGSTCFWFQDGTSADIYNNVFNNATANNEISVSEPATNTAFHVGIYNNTIYGGAPHINVGGTVAYGMGWLVGSNFDVKVVVENNLVSSLDIGNNNYFDILAQCTTNTLTTFTNNVLFNYNFYKSDQVMEGGVMVFGLWSQAGTYITPPSSPAIFGWDRNSLTGSPLFVQASTNNIAANNLALQSNSPAIGAGINLTSLNLPGLNADCTGVGRPATGNWVVGAYQTTTNASNGSGGNSGGNGGNGAGISAFVPGGGGSDITNGLLVCYRFNQINGTTATDSSGNGQTGSLTGSATWTTGLVGTRAISFPSNDGLSSSADGVGASSVSYVGDWTITFWVYNNSFPGVLNYAATTAAATGVFVGPRSWGFYDGSALLSGSSPLSTQASYFIAVSKSAGTNYQLYLNGSANNAGTLANVNISSLTIGNRGGSFLGMNGSIEDFRIFSRVLATNEIATLAANGPDDVAASIPLPPTGLRVVSVGP